jgi:hypothetical protein
MGKHSILLIGILTALLVTNSFASVLPLVLLGLAAGVVGGLALEYTGVRILRLWSYGGGFPTRILIRGWGEIALVATLAIVWIPNLGFAFVVGILFPILYFELPNTRRNGWKYYAPRWLVFLGWAITIFTLQTSVLGMSWLL